VKRREALQSLLALAAGSPLLSQQQGKESVLDPVNIHEFEAVARKKMHPMAYDFIAGGTEEEQTIRANIAAFQRVFLVPRFMTDVSKIDTSIELFGVKMDSPIIIAPTGGKNLVMPNADEQVAQVAASTHTVMCAAAGTEKLAKEGKLTWWTNTTGQPSKNSAERYSRGVENTGAKAIVVTVDNPYQSNRDRNNRNRMDLGYMSTGIPKPGEPYKPRIPETAAMWLPHTPNLTWQYVDWLRSGSKLPIVLKGILSPEDAKMAVERGADGVVVSNHGGRQLDGAIATLDALPAVADAVAGRIPVLMDGGIRRGTDILKALGMGAKAVLTGRPPLWGLAAFGQPGVERVLWMLAAELKLSMALAGKTSLASIDRSLVRVI
jgi:4-hydroxymandelate oxidase